MLTCNTMNKIFSDLYFIKYKKLIMNCGRRSLVGRVLDYLVQRSDPIFRKNKNYFF